MRKIFIYCLWFLIVTFTLFLCKPISFAQTAIDYQQQKWKKHAWRNNLTTAFQKKSISLDVIYTSDFFSNIAGGYKRRSDYCYVVDLMITRTLDSLLWKRNAAFGFDIVGIDGVNPSDTVGDFQGVSNIAAPQTWRLYETWFQVDIIEERLTFLFGMFDVNSEFYVNETATLFVNSSFAIGPEFSQSGRNGAPTFPNPGLGLRLTTRISDNISLKTAIMDGDATAPDNTWRKRYKINRNEGALLTLEVSFASNEEKLKTLVPSSKRIQRRRHRMRFDHLRNTSHKIRRRFQEDRPFFIDMPKGNYSKYALGSWYYTAKLDNLIENSEPEPNKHHKGNWGVYSTGEKMLWQNSDNLMQAVSVFFHAGISDKNVNKVDMSFAVGIVYSGNFFKHFQDQIGCGLTAAHMSNGFQTTFFNDGKKPDDWEIAAEISYRTQVKKTWSFQPDIQYIINPGYEPGFNNATVIGIRLEIAF